MNGERIAAENQKRLKWVEEDYDHLGRQLARRGVDIEKLTERAAAFRVSVPSWGLGTGGTRFARYPGPGEPRNVFEKIEDCEVVFQLVRSTPGVSLHIPWDQPESPAELKAFAQELVEKMPPASAFAAESPVPIAPVPMDPPPVTVQLPDGP